MFKQGRGSALIQQQRTIVYPQRHVTSQRLIPNDDHRRNKEMKGILNLYGELDGNLGVIKMNREHRFNTLTDAMVIDITRGVDTMNNDFQCHAIYLGTEKGEHWSNGTDFRTIVHLKKEDNYARITEYMKQLYHCQTNLAKINKPLIAVAPGHAFNSGAALLAACSHPMTTLDAKVAFNETTFGFVPHSGGSYYMSRMKGEFGTFMALTGIPIHGSEAQRMDITRGIVHHPNEYSQEVADHVHTMPFPVFGGRDLLERTKKESQFFTPWQQQVKLRQDEKHKLIKTEPSMLHRGQLDLDIMDPLREPADRVQLSTAEANFKYMKYIKNDAAKHENEGQGYLEFDEGAPNRAGQFVYKNYFKECMDYISGRIGNGGPQHHGVAVNHQMMLDRCFFSSSVEEIMDNLKRETHPFAKECLEAMERNSPQAMQLALKMLREAKNLDYKGCLTMELNVAFNRIQDDDFDLGVKSVIMTRKEKGAKHKKRPDWAPLMKTRELDRYFQENEHAKSIDLGIVEHALLPTKNYYSRFTDQVRLWINQESTTQEKIREMFDMEARQALQEQGIDARDLAITPEIARNHLAAKLAKERVDEISAERAEQLMTDQKLRKRYFEQIDQEVEKFAKNDKLFYQQVNKYVSQTFQDAFIDRLDHVFKKSSEAQDLVKRRMYIRMKKFLFKQRILAYGTEQCELNQKQYESMHYMVPHLTEKWDQSYRDMEHPELVKSPLYLLSKAIGRISLTTPELTKAYMTDPGNRDAMTMFTFDKSEIEKLNKDVIANPGKYEMIFRSFQDRNDAQIQDIKLEHLDRQLRDIKQEEIDYWYRFYNNGVCPDDSLPWVQEYNDYKSWADRIEHNAINTLRTAINSILLDHENMEVHDGKFKELFNKVHNHKRKDKKQKKKDESSRLGAPERPLNDIRYSIRQMLGNHPHYSSIFSQQELHKNSRVAKLKDEFESELLKLVEIVLLDKYSDELDPTIITHMQKRLAHLTNPTGRNVGLSLNLIDQYLHRKNGEALVADAFDMVGPFFSQMMKSRLQYEIEDIQRDLNWEKIEGDVLVYYFLNKSYPNFRNQVAYRKYMNFSLDEDVYQRALAMYPFMSEWHQRNSMLSMIGSTDLDYKKGASIGELQHESLETTREELKFIGEFDKSQNSLPEFQVSSEEERLKHMELTDQELVILEEMNTQLLDVYEFLQDHKYEIDHHMNDFDSLQFLALSIKNYDLKLHETQDTHDEAHWNRLEGYVTFVADMCTALNEDAKTHRFDAMQFLEQQNSTNNVQSSNFYQAARAERDKIIELGEKNTYVDRHNLIKNDITDFNQLQQQVRNEKQIHAHLNNLIDKKPKDVKRDLIEFLTQHEYIDLGLMMKHVENDKYDFLKEPHSVINVAKAIKGIKPSADQLDSAVDVVSLHNLKKEISQDARISDKEKKNLNTVVSYICDQTKYISNKERQNLSVKDYLDKHHFTSPEAFKIYAQDVLKSKIEKILGTVTLETPEMVEWQLGDTRTMPYEHVEKEGAEKCLNLALDMLENAGAIPDSQPKFTKQTLNPATPENTLTDEQVLQMMGYKQDQIKEALDEAKKYMETESVAKMTEAEENQLLHELEENASSGDDEQYPSIGELRTLQRNLRSPEPTKFIDELRENAHNPSLNYDDPQSKYIVYKEAATGREQTDTFRDYHNKEVYRKARENVEMPLEMEVTKNLYEHKILLAMMEDDFKEADVHRTFEEYTNIRLQHCLLNKTFAEGIRSDNGHIFMKVLREQIIGELNLNQDARGQDITYQNVMDEFKHTQFYNMENAYNMNDLNNENAIGFDNLLERARAQSAEENYTTAHETVFDKLLGEYFLNQRGEYKESNKLLNQLAEIFENPQATYKKGNSMDHLERKHMQNMIGTAEHATLKPQNFRQMIQLDVAASRAMQDNKPGMSEKLRHLSITEKDHPEYFKTQVPKYFELFDVRKPAKEYVDDKLMMVIRDAFAVRAGVEQKMTRAELVAFDKVLARYLQKDKLMPRLVRAIQDDYDALHNTKSLVYQAKDHLRENEMVQGMKQPHDQRGINKRIKDENAQFKSMAFMAMMDKRNKAIADEDRDMGPAFNAETFDEYYKMELQKDAQREPRKINPDDFKVRKPWDKPVNQPWRNEQERIEDLWSDHSIYLENKKEQQQRIQLFYILEQFYEESRTKPNESSKGQKIVKEYFAEPDNTHFFDMNKLV